MIELTTPAMLFPAISLLLLAYTNRFSVLAQILRKLHREIDDGKSFNVHKQIENLSFRVKLIKWMQGFGIISFALCTLSMISVYLGGSAAGDVLFLASLITLCISLLLSLWEIHISADAINFEIENLKRNKSD